MTMIVVDPDINAAHDREWERLAAPGTWLTGSERVAVARTARGVNRLLDAIGVGPPAQMAAIGEQIGVPLPDRWR